MKPRSRYGAVDPMNPEAAGRCQRGGEIRKRSELKKQMEWRGDRLAWTGFWVCAQHMDEPQPQNRAKRLRADPVPISEPLPNIDAEG
jgi:hypothetical protein